MFLPGVTFVKKLLFTAALVLAFSLSYGAVKAEVVYRDDEYLAQVAKIDAADKVDWVQLRALYVETSFYDPYGGAQTIWYGLQQLGQQVLEDPKGPALGKYREMLSHHFAHYRSHLQAIDLANKAGNSAPVNKAFHEAALRGILRSVLSSGDGKTPETAYHVIDPAEEQMVLITHRLRQNGQDFRQKNGHFWDVVKYKNPRNNTEGEMYFNVDTILAKSSKR